jgi:DNA polymerase large subunit
MRDTNERYFEHIETRLDEAFAVAREAKERGGDPKPEVEIPVAQDMADRVENILGIEGVAERVRELDGQMSREEAALALAEDFAEGRVGEYETTAGIVEGAVRTAVALLTEGVVAAPIEGIDRVEVLDNDDGTEFVRVFYAGPIRSAGGTAQALSVLVADYARTLLGLDRYKPRDDEVERYAEEVDLYDSETGLQYSPKDKETKFIAEHCPIMLDGEATGEEEVSGFRDLERVGTNNPRGGMCLVLAEGIAQKAPKIKRYTGQLDEVDWPWLDDLIEGTIGKDEEDAGDESLDSNTDADTDADAIEESDDVPSDSDTTGTSGPPRVEPTTKFLRDLIAGRPVFSHPSRAGGFRLRYGRARNHGFATAGVHPATMHLVDDFLATGTQIKTERPGKAAGVVPVDTIEGPTVRLANGDVRRIDDPEEALTVRNGVEAILDPGEYLVNYGEFVENNHPLAPASYTVEWWVQDLDHAGKDVQALHDDPHTDLDDPSIEEALAWVTEYDAPLHPQYTYLWHDLPVDQFEMLAEVVSEGHWKGDDTSMLVIPRSNSVCEALETLLVEHTQGDETVTVPDALALVRSLGLTDDLEKQWTGDDLSAEAQTWTDGENAIKAVNEVAPFIVRERAPTRIGNRMGRPEKSEKRELSPAVHTLFPIGEAGGNQRDVTQATSHTESMHAATGQIEVQIARRECVDCETSTFKARCPDCNGVAQPVYECRSCDIRVEPDESGRAECPRCGDSASPVERRTLDLADEYRASLSSVGERESAFDILKGVKGLTSEEKVPEPIEKGVLRAKHGVSTFKDGTIRYDMTDLPVTAVRPAELGVSAEQFRSLGYETDIDGEPLRHDDQLVELRVQDIVLSEGGAEHMLKTADFVDDLLEQYYGLEPFYTLDERDDLVGELVFGMAPHTSAAVVGRVVGFTSAAVGYAHPYFHAAKRRNCFHPDTNIWYESEDGDVRQERIEEFVEERLIDPREDDFGTLAQDLDGDIRVPSIDENGSPVRKPVTAVSKHPAPDHLISIETHSGRTLSVTPDHTMLRWEGSIERVPASELAVGDTLPTQSVHSPNPRKTEGSSIERDEITHVEIVDPDVDSTYCLTVEKTHTLVANNILTGNCDGDEDCVMLLMDGLLNFSKLYLPDKRGGSVAEDSRLVAFGPDGEVRHLTFGEFWGQLDCPIEYDGKFQKKTCLEEGWTTYAFDKNHESTPKPIEKAIRYRADEDEQLLRVETQFGRSLDITANHSLFRYDDEIEDVAGEDLEEGDLIVAPQQLDIETKDTTIDVTECLDSPYISVHEADSDSKQKLPFEMLSNGETAQDPTSPQIYRKESETGIDRHIPVDTDFAWLLGVFIAGGSLSGSNPTLSIEESTIDRVTDISAASLGCEPSVERSDNSCRVHFPVVFEDVLHHLGFGSPEDSSGEKRIPDCILRAEHEVALSFIRGYMAGDEGRDEDAYDDPTSIEFHTTGEAVKDGLVFLLHRLGLVADISKHTDNEPEGTSYTLRASRSSNETPQRSNGNEPQPKRLEVSIPSALLELREMDIQGVKQLIPSSLKYRENISIAKLGEIIDELDRRELPEKAEVRLNAFRPLVEGDLSYLRITNIERVDYDGYLYDLQVGGEPIFTANWLYAHNSMDAPLVMSSRIDPTEIDDEAHNVDIVDSYPREFYEATRRMADPDEVDITIAEETLETDREYSGFKHTHDTSNIAAGPDLSAYKTLGSMMDKMNAQLELARKLRAVDETDVAERVIEYHFLPDLIGNLRAFSRQETRCLDCGKKYRRMPLSGECRECGGRVNLTVHEGSVNKYMDTAIRVADEYDCREYTKQRLAILERSLESVFENDKNKQSGIADFM